MHLADVIGPMHCSDGIGSSGAEGVSAASLTSSLDNSTSIAPMPLSGPSVKPVLLSFPHLTQLAHPIASMLRASVYPATIGCTDGMASVKPVQLILHYFVQFVAGSFGCLKYILSHFGTSTTDWTCHFDGGLDMTS